MPEKRPIDLIPVTEARKLLGVSPADQLRVVSEITRSLNCLATVGKQPSHCVVDAIL